MNFFFLHQQPKIRKGEPGRHLLVSRPAHERNINEGSEFLNDAIRMKDLALIYTEQAIDAVDPKDLYDYSAE